MKYLDLTSEKELPKFLLTKLSEGCHRLTIVKFTNAAWCDDNFVKKLLFNNPNLSIVDLSNCSKLKNGSLQPLAVRCKKLESLLLQNCFWMTVGAMEIFTHHLSPSLKIVDLTGCVRVSEGAIILLLSKQPKLVKLSLAGLAVVNDETLRSVSGFCTQLEHLNISKCLRVTDKGIKILSEHCSTLRSLEVQGCNLVSDKSLADLRQRGVVIDRKSQKKRNYTNFRFSGLLMAPDFRT